MKKDIIEKLEVIRSQLSSNPASIIYGKMGKKNFDIPYINNNIPEYYEFLKICDGARFGDIDLSPYKDLKAIQYDKTEILSKAEDWIIIGQILYQPLAINLLNGKMMCFSRHYGDEGRIIYEFDGFEKFLEHCIVPRMYRIISPNYKEDKWYIFLQALYKNL